MAEAERRTTEEFREAVVAEATRLFADRGFAGTSVQEIADAVGCSKQLVLYHFGSKDAIREAVMTTVRDAWTTFLPVLVQLATQGGDRVAGAGAAFADLLGRHPHASRLVLRDLITEDGAVRQSLYDLVRPYLRLAAEGVAAAQGVEGPLALERAQAQVQLMGIVLLSTHALFGTGSGPLEGGVPGERMAEEATEMIRRYLQV
jgi:TetR/AcrR family transcriptional regulator